MSRYDHKIETSPQGIAEINSVICPESQNDEILKALEMKIPFCTVCKRQKR